VLSLFVTVTLVAWGVLVFAAIEFGRQARSGESTAWTFLGLASAGATACLFVTMILGARLVAVVRGRQGAPRAARIPGGRRAAR
jgi:RsiW-degrading membrane proteinase PrsW (M82 family)